MSGAIAVMEMLRMTEAHFTHADVVAITGVASSDLQNWVNRGHLSAANDPPGKQGKRRYDTTRLLLVEIASRLIGLGLQASYAFKIADQATSNALKYILDKSTVDETTKTIEVVDLDIRSVFTAVRTTADKEHLLTTFVDTNIPADRLLDQPALIINTGQLAISLLVKIGQYLEATVPDPANAEVDALQAAS
jgi:hypothetical protein